MSTPKTDDPGFEEAVARLETIVSKLERGEGDLSAALEGYELGVRMLTRCHALLEQAEKSVAVLTGVDEEGQPTTTSFDATATVAPEPSEKPRARRGTKG